jgi:hypothetical protein
MSAPWSKAKAITPSTSSRVIMICSSSTSLMEHMFWMLAAVMVRVPDQSLGQGQTHKSSGLTMTNGILHRQGQATTQSTYHSLKPMPPNPCPPARGMS